MLLIHCGSCRLNIEAVANDKVNFATLQAYNDSVVAKGLPAIKNLLTEDVHKNYVWSFRYVHPENAGNVTEEGVEKSVLVRIEQL